MQTKVTVGAGPGSSAKEGREAGTRTPWSERAALERLARWITLAGGAREHLTVQTPFTG